MTISEQIVSLPYQITSIPEAHQEGLESTGKTFFVARSFAEYDERVSSALSFTKPDLIICDYGWLNPALAAATCRKNLAFLRTTPMIVVGDERYKTLKDYKQVFNLIGVLNTSAQFEPEEIAKVVTAFYAAQAQGVVTAKSYATAIKADEARLTALDKRSNQPQAPRAAL